MAEMTALTVGIYREYTTSIASGFEDKTPGITSRFEVFSDEAFSEVAVSRANVPAFEAGRADRKALQGTYMHDSL